MKAKDLTDKELRREIYRIRRGLRKDIAEIKALQPLYENMPTSAIEDMRAYEKRMREKSVRRMDRQELLDIYRDLRYTRNLKSSTPEGAIFLMANWEEIRKHISTFSEDTQREWWSVWNRLRKYSPIFEKFKYEIFKVIDVAFTGKNAEQLSLKILRDFDKTIKSCGGTLTDEQIKQKFTSKLEKYRKKFQDK